MYFSKQFQTQEQEIKSPCWICLWSLRSNLDKNGSLHCLQIKMGMEIPLLLYVLYQTTARYKYLLNSLHFLFQFQRAGDGGVGVGDGGGGGVGGVDTVDTVDMVYTVNMV